MTITWTTNEPAVIVDAPEREAYDFGLFSVLDFGADERGSVPIRWDSRGYLLPTAVQDVCLHGGAPHTKVDTLNCWAPQFSTGFSVYTFDTPTLAIGRIDSEAARRQLEYAEQPVVEAFLLRLIIENDVAAAALGNTTPVSMLGRVEQELAARGTKGTILMSRYLAITLLASGALETNGTQLRTKLGTPVAAVGIIPAGANALEIYGVTGLKGVRGEISDGEAINPNINDLSAFAERDYSIGFEGQAISALAVIA